jgi:hypothetical protein
VEPARVAHYNLGESLFELSIRLGGKADRDNGAEGKPEQHKSIPGVMHRGASIRLEQERSEDQAAYDRDKQAHQAPAKMSYTNDHENKYRRHRGFHSTVTEVERQTKGQSAAKYDYQQRL